VFREKGLTESRIPYVPKAIQRGISWLLHYIGGVIIGEKLLGLKSSYPEYYDDDKKDS
jgi:hypothetical protein